MRFVGEREVIQLVLVSPIHANLRLRIAHLQDKRNDEPQVAVAPYTDAVALFVRDGIESVHGMGGNAYQLGERSNFVGNGIGQGNPRVRAEAPQAPA